MSNLLTNRNHSDIETCYKAFRVGVIKPLQLTSKGFGMEVEITAMICKTKARTYEVPISYYGVTVFQNGSWHTGSEFAGYETEGQDLQSLFDYLVEKGLVHCCPDKLLDRLIAGGVGDRVRDSRELSVHPG